MYAARKHTGKVGPRAVKKSPIRKSSGQSSPSPKAMKESSSPLTDHEDTNITQSKTSPAKDENESPQNEESEVEATSAQSGETAMDTGVEVDSTGRDDEEQGPSSKAEEIAATTKSTVEKKAKKDTKKIKQKIHPFFGIFI